MNGVDRPPIPGSDEPDKHSAPGSAPTSELSKAVNELGQSFDQLSRRMLDASNFDDACSTMRGMLREAGRNVLALKNHPQLVVAKIADAPGWLPEDPDRGEMIANVTLAYRHIEDAIMRLGKAIQAYDGGKSVYAK